MSGKIRPSLRNKTLENVKYCNLSNTDKDCIKAVFEKLDEQQAEIAELKELLMIWQEKFKVVRIKTAKEFVKRIKIHKFESRDWSHGEHPYVVEESDIDDVLEEMMGDEQ